MICVYDIETYKYAFIVCCKNINTGETLEFEISFRKDDRVRLINHILKIKGQVGFNNINFDYPILHWFLLNQQNYSKDSLPEAIYNEANRIISEERTSINPKEVAVPQLDLYRIWHYHNKAKSTSLKYLEFNLRMDDIQDLPYKIDEELDDEKIDKIIKYCHHDVLATYNFYLKSKNKISLRKKLSNKYNLNLMNQPDVGMGENLVLDSYCKLTGKDKQEVRNLRSEYKFIQGKDVIFPSIKFETEEMNNWLNKLKNIYLKRVDFFWEGEIIKLFGQDYQVGLGGLHIEQIPGVYEKEDYQFLTEWDCAGMYPTFIALHGQYPRHLGKEFLTLYRDIRDARMVAKKTGDKVMDAAGKLIGNGTFGLKKNLNIIWIYKKYLVYL